jgi:hypothetical protein
MLRLVWRGSALYTSIYNRFKQVTAIQYYFPTEPRKDTGFYLPIVYIRLKIQSNSVRVKCFI